MNGMRDMEIIWDDLLEAFANTDSELIFFLDRFTGEVFFVPAEYEDEAFWEEIETNPDQFLHIPEFDYEQERMLLREFINSVTNEKLKGMLDKAFAGQGHGRLEDILSFYPDELDRLFALKEEMLAERIKHWLEENDIFPASESF